jgi:hypothetical protein
MPEKSRFSALLVAGARGEAPNHGDASGQLPHLRSVVARLWQLPLPAGKTLSRTFFPFKPAQPDHRAFARRDRDRLRWCHLEYTCRIEGQKLGSVSQAELTLQDVTC